MKIFFLKKKKKINKGLHRCHNNPIQVKIIGPTPRANLELFILFFQSKIKGNVKLVDIALSDT